MKTLIYSLVGSLLFLAACTNGKNKKQDSAVADSTAKSVSKETSPEKKSPTAALLSGYLKLKNALTTDDDKEAAAAGNEMVAAFAAFDKKSLTSEQGKACRAHWFQCREYRPSA